MQSLENFDFLAFRDALSEKASKYDGELSRGKVQNAADVALVACGYYDSLFAVDKHNERQKVGNGKEYARWWRDSSKRKLIEEVLVTAETIGLIELIRTESSGPDGQWKTRYYKVIDNRSRFEILQDMIPWSSNQEILMILKIMNTSDLRCAAKIYEDYLKTNITNDIP